jgi:hypothetical protein
MADAVTSKDIEDVNKKIAALGKSLNDAIKQNTDDHKKIYEFIDHEVQLIFKKFTEDIVSLQKRINALEKN